MFEIFVGSFFCDICEVLPKQAILLDQLHNEPTIFPVMPL